MTEGLVWPPKKSDLERLYLVEKLSAAKIARAYGLKYASRKTAESTVLYHLKRNAIVRRDKAEHIRKVTSEMVDAWVSRYESGESLSKLAGDEVDPVTVWNHLRERNVVLRDKVDAQIRAVTKYRRVPFSGDKIKKAYLLGLRYGDLNAVRHGRAIRVRVSTTHPAMANLFKTLFSPYGQVKTYPRTARLTGFEWTLECDLDVSYGFMLEKPELDEVRSLPSDEFKAFLAGLVDAEGTIYLHRKSNGSSFEFHISNTDVRLIDLVESRLRVFGFHPYRETKAQDELRLGYPVKGTIEVLSILRQGEVCQILRDLPLAHQEKVEKSKFVITRVCGDRIGIGEDEIMDWEDLILRIREERDSYVRDAQDSLAKLPNH